MKILYFFRKDCAACPPIATILAKHSDLNIESIDVDRFPEVANQYYICSVPTVIYIGYKDKVLAEAHSVTGVQKLLQYHEDKRE